MSEAVACGYVAIVGHPNVGKSTLLNALLETKLAITTKKPQTTRNQIVGILQQEDAQIVFVDTPGIHRSTKRLNKVMVETALAALEDADVALIMSDYIPSGEQLPPNCNLGLKELERILPSIHIPKILAFNKIDQLKQKDLLLPMLEEAAQREQFEQIIPISALTGDGLAQLTEAIKDYLPKQPRFFPEDALTEVSERFMVSEIIREKLLINTHQEVPYATAIQIEQFEDKRPPDGREGGLCRILATIYVERNSQKGIIIGKGGSMLKKIGMQSRSDMEQLLGSKVYLDVVVKVKEKWTEDMSQLTRFGYLPRPE